MLTQRSADCCDGDITEEMEHKDQAEINYKSHHSVKNNWLVSVSHQDIRLNAFIKRVEVSHLIKINNGSLMNVN